MSITLGNFFLKSLFVPGREVANPCCLHHLTFSSAQRHANDPSASVLLRADLLISPNDMRSHSDDDGVCFCTLNIHCHEDKVLELASKSQIPCSYICATFHGTHYSRCEPSSAREDWKRRDAFIRSLNKFFPDNETPLLSYAFVAEHISIFRLIWKSLHSPSTLPLTTPC